MTEYLIINKDGLEADLKESRKEALESKKWLEDNQPENGPYKIERA